MCYLHERDIIHRDLKPENLLYFNDKEDARLVLADFGIAKHLDSPDEVLTAAAGSIGYAGTCEGASLGCLSGFASSADDLFSSLSPGDLDQQGTRKACRPVVRLLFPLSPFQTSSAQSLSRLSPLVLPSRSLGSVCS